MLKFSVSFECVMGLNQLLKLPNVGNARYKLIALRNKAKGEVGIELQDQFEGIVPYEVCHALWVGYSTRPKDVDNLASGLKMILDEIKDNGVVADDNYKIVRSLVSVPVKVAHQPERRYEFYLGNLEEIISKYRELVT